MARQKSSIKIEGTIGDLTFYRIGSKYFVRKKRGVSAERVAKDPAYARTRENAAEFASCAQSGKTFRNAFARLSKKVPKDGINQKVIKLMHALKKLDHSSDRGKRNVATGIEHPDAKALFKGFDFNKYATLNSIFSGQIKVDRSSGKVSIVDFNSAKHINKAQSATHLSFQSLWVNIDFSKNSFDGILSDVHELPIENRVENIELTTIAPKQASGQHFFALLIEFFQEVNGIQYPLKNSSHNVLNIIEVE